MKKILFTLSFILLSTLICHSQFFIGGSVSMSSSAGTEDNDGNVSEDPSSFSLTVNPEVGFSVSDKLDMGTGLYFGYSRHDNNQDLAYTRNTTSIGIRPFVRYYAFRVEKFSIYGLCMGNIGFSKTISTLGEEDLDDVKSVDVGLHITPGIAYDISNKIQLFAGLNFVSLNLNYYKEKQGVRSQHSTDFNFGANTNFLFTTGSISVGAIIKL